MSSRKAFFVWLAFTISMLASLSPIGPAALVYAATPPLIDDFEAGLPAGTDASGVAVGFSTFQDPNSSVAISTTASPPAQPPGATSPNSVLKLDVDVAAYAGFAHSLENAAVNEWVAQDWSAYAGISLWLYGNNSGTTLFIDVLDNRNPGSTKDDAERWSVDFKDDFSGWRQIQFPFASLHRKEVGNGAPNDDLGLTEAHGWALGAVTTPSAQTYYVDDVRLYGTAPERPLTVSFSAINYSVVEGGTATVTARLSKPASTTVTVQYRPTLGAAVAGRDYALAAGTLSFAPGTTQKSFSVATFDNAKYQGVRGVLVELANPTGGAVLGKPPIARVAIQDNESYDPSLLDDFESFPYLWTPGDKATLGNPEIVAGSSLALPGQGAYERVLQAGPSNGQVAYEFGRRFPTAQDWSNSAALSFWYYGQNSGRAIDLQLESGLASTKPADFRLVWSDEFNAKAGAAPNPSVWGRELGDGTANGNTGWGNDELQYYTDSTENAATDGRGNLAITVRQADGSRQCYYGACQFTSARLLTKNRFEVAYGRVEARVKVPRGAGLWPAFWMLGSDIDRVDWPKTGEIDIMEHVGRLPNQIFGTIHGPGYSGGQSYGKNVDLGKPVADDFHTYAVEWQPNKIVWFLDGQPYFTATPNDAFLQGKQWVFNHPFFMLLNVAVGGNFGGAVGPDTTFPQATLVDYVRLYQAAPRTTKFHAEIRDNFAGWKQISIPFTSFRGPNGATLDLSAIQSLRFAAPSGLRNPVRIDQLRLSCAPEVTVTNAADSGAGSLRKALDSVCVGGTITFAPALAGQTIMLSSGPLTLGKNVSVDASAAAGLTLSGNDADRVLIVNAGTTVTVKGLAITKGYGWQLAGGVLNNGNLTLDHVTVSNNRMATDAGDYWQGGGGIYSGDGAKLQLIDSTVANNHAAWSGGGVYSFFNTTTTIVRSTISGNVSNDVGGGIRALGNVSITNSTISGNTSTGWHGGAIFQTDGNLTITSSTLADNAGPDWAPSTIFIGQFGGSFVPTLTLSNSIITGNRWYACERFASGKAANIVSNGHNLMQDDTCVPVTGDLVAIDAKLGGLAANGGPTRTHALLAGSPAIDAADDASAPATDQRGVARPQGPRADMGAYEAP